MKTSVKTIVAEMVVNPTLFDNNIGEIGELVSILDNTEDNEILDFSAGLIKGLVALIVFSLGE